MRDRKRLLMWWLWESVGQETTSSVVAVGECGGGEELRCGQLSQPTLFTHTEKIWRSGSQSTHLHITDWCGLLGQHVFVCVFVCVLV